MDNNDRLRMATEGNEPLRAVNSVPSRYPSTSTTGTPSTPTNSNTSATAAAAVTEPEDIAAATAAERNVTVLGGELGKNVVFLSDAQIADLLDLMGVDTFDYYVDKLSRFILQNNARVKNHYDTILKWWKEDAALHGPNR